MIAVAWRERMGQVEALVVPPNLTSAGDRPLSSAFGVTARAWFMRGNTMSEASERITHGRL